MSANKAVVERFFAALVAQDTAALEAVLSPNVALRVSRWNGGEMYRPRHRVLPRLQSEWAAWPDPKLTLFTLLADGDQVAVEYRIQATEDERYVEHNRSAFIKISDDQITLLDVYMPEAIPSARRKGWIAPPTLSEREMQHLFETLQYSFDTRDWLPPNMNNVFSLRGGRGGSGDAHPGSNGCGGSRWTAAEADSKIAEIIDYHRTRNIGFQWFLGPFDTPSDLAERLERHGLVLAGDQAVMARLGLDNLDIPINPAVTVEVMDENTPEADLETSIQITATAFNWPQAQVDEWRTGTFERIRNPEIRKEEISYLARYEGVPVANARLILRTGVAYLGGAATLPAYRSKKIYSTLLRRRLEDAHAHGYHLAAIHAEPMSRRVVTRYGFNEYARFLIYAWMPVIDMAIIRGLVPDE